jgi:5-hydroxyisourate hydrolase
MGISTHVLDTGLGLPGARIGVTLERLRQGKWEQLAQAATSADGRAELLPRSKPPAPGTYRMTFKVREYFRRQKVEGLYPAVEISFTVARGEKHYHIPLLLSANGYTTYRGS